MRLYVGQPGLVAAEPKAREGNPGYRVLAAPNDGVALGITWISACDFNDHFRALTHQEWQLTRFTDNELITMSITDEENEMAKGKYKGGGGKMAKGGKTNTGKCSGPSKVTAERPDVKATPTHPNPYPNGLS